MSVETGHALAEVLHVFPHLRVLGPLVLRLLVRLRGGGVVFRAVAEILWSEPEVFLEVAQGGREVLQVVGEQTAIAQFRDRGRVDGQQQVGDEARMRT
jgi:hypothetical protein